VERLSTAVMTQPHLSTTDQPNADFEQHVRESSRSRLEIDETDIGIDWPKSDTDLPAVRIRCVSVERDSHAADPS
jgi:hypothetical protein